ncbi:MAG TPA: RHS repeat-associated core domain-containing protein, partial [bacterium]|nr:RHS repeat-associated core domain-containing protein [bacterium]
SLYFDAAARFQRALQSIPLGKRREAPYAMWSESINGASIRQSKHVYVGQTRVSTRLNYKGHPDTGFEQANTYYYHGDHLGSAQLVTDPDGQEYEHLEYTPYGELWVEKTRDGIDAIPFRFTGKELDPETGLYYYGARYLDPKTSVWLSADPALGEYVPGAPTDEEARKRNGNLPGMGGVFNTVNLHLYHYAGNNPIKYTDPDGKAVNVLAGAFIGAVVSASMNVISQYASAKMSGSSFQLDVNQTLAAAAGGAVAGAITSGASAVASLCYQPTAQVATAVGGAIAGSAGSVVSTIVENGMGGKPLTDGVKESAVIGAIAGGVSSALVPAAKVLYRAPAPYTQITATSVARDTIKELGNGAKDEVITRSVKRALE